VSYQTTDNSILLAMEAQKDIQLPVQVKLLPGNGGLPKLAIQSASSTAEIYLHGAHVSGFQKNGESPLLFLSAASRFEANQPIRGGVPVIFPWFGARAGQSSHGFARHLTWKLDSAAAEVNGDVTVRLHLPQAVVPAEWQMARAEFSVIVGSRLTMELTVTNRSTDKPLNFENCLHTYFHVGDIGAVSITGLQGAAYIDKVDQFVGKREHGPAIVIGSEVDRVFPNATGPVEIHARNLRRTIVVEKSGSASTVVWNPWVAKSKAMPDFGDEEYKQMVCVESGSVGENQLTLPPGKSQTLKAILSTRPE
jgi:glucose-6-phosphate 1-epimerase